MRTSRGYSSAAKRARSSEQGGGLRDELSLYASIVRHLHVGIAVWHLDDGKDSKACQLLFANPAAQKYLNGTGAAARGGSDANFADFPNLRLPALLQEVVISGQPKELGEIRHAAQGAPDRIFSVRLYPLPNHCVCLAFEDLAQEKQAAQLLELAADSIFVCDMDGRITYWNRGAERMYGWSKDEALGRSAFQILKTESSLPLEDIRTILLQGGHWHGELCHKKKDGTRITVASYWTLQKDSTGGPLGWIQIANDVTEEKRTGEALRRTEQDFQLLVDSIRDYAIFHLDPQGRVATWNLGARRIKGYLRDEIVGKHFSIFYLPEDIASGKPEAALKIAAEEGRYQFGGWRVRKDGSRFMASVTITALRDESGQLRGFGKVTRDITERTEMEKTYQEKRALQQRATEISLLSQLGTLLHSCVTTEEAFKVFAQFAPQLFPAESGALYILSPSRNVMESASNWGDFSPAEQVFPPDDCWALRSGRMHYVEGPGSAVLCRHLSGTPTVAHLCVPMVALGDTLGILHVHSNPVNLPGAMKAIHPLSVSKRQLVTAVAEQVGLALANLKLRETLRVLSVRDPLTGLFNRRFMQESLERELRRASRSDKPLGAILLDVDHFKRFNDSFGHEAGDIVLRELGGFLQSQIRGEDIACRIGGEEFLLILPDTALEVTLQRAEKIREDAKRINLQYSGRPLSAITLSMGIASIPDHGSTSHVILRSADKALYQAKAQGRDRVVVAKTIEAP